MSIVYKIWNESIFTYDFLYLSDLMFSIFFLISFTSSFGALNEEVAGIVGLSSFKTTFFLYHQPTICPFVCFSRVLIVVLLLEVDVGDAEAEFEVVCCFPVGVKLETNGTTQ